MHLRLTLCGFPARVKGNPGQGDNRVNSRVTGWQMSRLRWVGIPAVALLVAGCESVPVHVEGADRGFAAVEEYRIGADDRVQVSVWRNPELSVIAPVRPDGKISLPLIGDVEAGGRTPGEGAENIKRIISTFIGEPKVAV